MSLSVTHSRSLTGLTAAAVDVEVHLANGLPSFTLVGLADTEVKESRERVRAALHSSGLEFPSNKRITVNLSPADLPKEGARFDLPIALGLLAASGQVDAQRLPHMECAGELALSGELRPVRGALAMALALRASGLTRELLLPRGSAAEAALMQGLVVREAAHLLEIVQALQPNSESHLTRVLVTPPLPTLEVHDLRDVKGQTGPKRALEVAAAGGLGLLLVGPPGTGKSMLARRLPGLLPPLDEAEALASAAVLSINGQFKPDQWGQRPFRSPHHSASAAALIGGGSPPRPGEITLAHHGVLFLDELPEFQRLALEALREPLETGRIHIARSCHQAEFPAQFQLIAAMNPCPCGHLGHPTKECRCTPEQIDRYQGRISGPLLDRIDLMVEVPVLPPRVLAAASEGESSGEVAARVAAAREVAVLRQGCINAQLPSSQLDQHLHLTPEAEALLHKAAARLAWSGRSYHRVLRMARTVADLAASAEVLPVHVSESIQWRRAFPGRE